MSDRARKPPTLEQRVARVMTSVVQGDRDAYIRTLIWRELRAAVRAERKACEQECRDVGNNCITWAAELAAKTCIARIKRRPKP